MRDLEYDTLVNSINDLKGSVANVITDYPKSVNSKYDLKECKSQVISILYKNSYATLDRGGAPQVLISGEIHGDERVGPQVALTIVKLLVYSSKCEIDKDDNNCKKLLDYDLSESEKQWLAFLASRRETIIIPIGNCNGYKNNERNDQIIDPNRDFNYMRSNSHCFNSNTAKLFYFIMTQNLIQSVVTYHGGMMAIGYEWGSNNHLSPNDASPDDMINIDIGQKMKDVAGAFKNVPLYQVGTMNSIVYPVEGGMEDWMYAAGWDRGYDSGSSSSSSSSSSSKTLKKCDGLVEIENSFIRTRRTRKLIQMTSYDKYGLQPQIEDNLYKNLLGNSADTESNKDNTSIRTSDIRHERQLTHMNVTNREIHNRAVVFLVETSDEKKPSDESLGESKEILNSESKYNGHIPRNVRLGLMAIDTVQPYVCFQHIHMSVHDINAVDNSAGDSNNNGNSNSNNNYAPSMDKNSGGENDSESSTATTATASTLSSKDAKQGSNGGLTNEEESTLIEDSILRKSQQHRQMISMDDIAPTTTATTSTKVSNTKPYHTRLERGTTDESTTATTATGYDYTYNMKLQWYIGGSFIVDATWLSLHVIGPLPSTTTTTNTKSSDATTTTTTTNANQESNNANTNTNADPNSPESLLQYYQSQAYLSDYDYNNRLKYNWNDYLNTLQPPKTILDHHKIYHENTDNPNKSRKNNNNNNNVRQKQRSRQLYQSAASTTSTTKTDESYPRRPIKSSSSSKSRSTSATTRNTLLTVDISPYHSGYSRWGKHGETLQKAFHNTSSHIFTSHIRFHTMKKSVSMPTRTTTTTTTTTAISDGNNHRSRRTTTAYPRILNHKLLSSDNDFPSSTTTTTTSNRSTSHATQNHRHLTSKQLQTSSSSSSSAQHIHALTIEPGIYWIVAWSIVDQHWGKSKQGYPTDTPPQSILAKARTDPNWSISLQDVKSGNITRKVQGRKFWPSDPIIVHVYENGTIYVDTAVLNCAWYNNQNRMVNAMFPVGTTVDKNIPNTPNTNQNVPNTDQNLPNSNIMNTDTNTHDMTSQKESTNDIKLIEPGSPHTQSTINSSSIIMIIVIIIGCVYFFRRKLQGYWSNMRRRVRTIGPNRNTTQQQQSSSLHRAIDLEYQLEEQKSFLKL